MQMQDTCEANRRWTVETHSGYHTVNKYHCGVRFLEHGDVQSRSLQGVNLDDEANRCRQCSYYRSHCLKGSFSYSFDMLFISCRRGSVFIPLASSSTAQSWPRTKTCWTSSQCNLTCVISIKLPNLAADVATIALGPFSTSRMGGLYPSNMTCFMLLILEDTLHRKV